MKAVIYARYSSHNQTEQSIEGQLRFCHKYAESCGYRIIGEYIDRAISGTSDNRPEFQRMVTAAEKKQFNYIIVWKLDRFSRNRYYSAKNRKSQVQSIKLPCEQILLGAEDIRLRHYEQFDKRQFLGLFAELGPPARRPAHEGGYDVCLPQRGRGTACGG